MLINFLPVKAESRDTIKMLHEKMNAARPFWISLGIAATGLGLVGVALPLLPTTPFLLLAAFAFARSSPRLHGWLLSHPQFGPLIEDWRRHGAVSRRAKLLAILTMSAALLLTWAAGYSLAVLAVQAAVLCGVAAFLLTRPEGPRMS